MTSQLSRHSRDFWLKVTLELRSIGHISSQGWYYSIAINHCHLWPITNRNQHLPPELVLLPPKVIILTQAKSQPKMAWAGLAQAPFQNFSRIKDFWLEIKLLTDGHSSTSLYMGGIPLRQSTTIIYDSLPTDTNTSPKARVDTSKMLR